MDETAFLSKWGGGGGVSTAGLVAPGLGYNAPATKAPPVRTGNRILNTFAPIAGGLIGGLAGGPMGAGAGVAAADLLTNKLEGDKQSMKQQLAGAGIQGLLTAGTGGLIDNVAAPAISSLLGGASEAAPAAAGGAASEAAPAAETAAKTFGGGFGGGARAAQYGVSLADLGGDTEQYGRLQQTIAENNIQGPANKALQTVTDLQDKANATVANMAKGNLGDNAMSQSDIVKNLNTALNNGNDSVARLYQSLPTDGADQKTMQSAFQKAIDMIQKPPGGGMDMQNLLDIRRSITDLAGKYTDATTQGANLAQDTLKFVGRQLGDIIGDPEMGGNPALRDAITQQHDLQTLKEGLQSSTNTGGFGARVGVGGVRLPVPGLGGAIQGVVGGVGQTLQALTGGAPLAPVLQAAVAPAIVAFGSQAANAAANKAANQKASSAGVPDFTQASPSMAAILQQSQSGADRNALGIDPATIQAAIVNDIQTTGGKNYTNLNRLYTIAKASQTAGAPTATETTALNNYQTSLSALNGVAQAFSGSGNAASVQTAITDATKALTTSSGLSAKNLASALPAPTDNLQVATQKLTALKQLIDNQAQVAYQDALNKAQPSDAQDLVTQLEGALTP